MKIWFAEWEKSYHEWESIQGEIQDIDKQLFQREEESKNLEKKSEREKEDNITNNNNNNIQYNNNNNLINNDKIIIEKNEFEHNSFEQTENELPDSNIESEIPNYDVSYIII